LTFAFVAPTNPAMDLLTLQARRKTKWTDLADQSGIHVGNLHGIAHGKRWFGPEYAEGLLKIGVDLNDQAKAYMRMRRLREAAEKIAS